MQQSPDATTNGMSSRLTAGDTLREALTLLWAVADRYARSRLVFALLFVAAGSLLTSVTPVALKLVVDALAANGGSSPHRATYFLVAIYVFGQYSVRCLIELRLLMFAQAEQRVRRCVAHRIFDHVVRLPMRFHLEHKVGAIGETVEQGLRGYDLLLSHVVYSLLPIGIEFAAVAIVLVHFGHGGLLVIFVVAAIGYILAFRRGAASIQDPAAAGSQAHVEAHSVLTDSLVNCEIVKYFDAERTVCNRYEQALHRTESAWRRFIRLRAGNGLTVVSIFSGSLATSLIYTAHGVHSGAMTVGDFVLINAYVVRIVQPLELLGMAIRDIAQGLAFLGSLLDLLKEEDEGAVRTREMEALTDAGELVFDNVSFSYGHGKSVLHNVSFSVPRNRTVAVVGASGSGKSSLVRLLFRLYEPGAGRILLDGAPIADLPLSFVRQVIAVVPQDTVLFHDTIAKNIAFGRSGADFSEIEEAARVANLHGFIRGLPEGYETVVGERGLRLSGGERQRVAIARAVLKRPHIWVFDEATSSLDTKTEREILGNLLSVASKSTTLVIAHRLSTVVHADEIVVLDKGAIVERGTHEHLLGRNGIYATLWRVQQDARLDLESHEPSAA